MVALTALGLRQHGSEFDSELALAVAGTIAQRLRRRGAIQVCDVDDLVGDLVLHAIQRWPLYDPSRSGTATFLGFIMARAATSVLRARRSPSRGHGRCRSLTYEAEARVTTAHQARGRNASTSSPIERAALRIDVRETIAGLPEDLRPYCALIGTRPLAASARLLGMKRHVLAAKVREIRKRFTAVGLEGYL